jgi:hypothetical protein
VPRHIQRPTDIGVVSLTTGPPIVRTDGIGSHSARGGTNDLAVDTDKRDCERRFEARGEQVLGVRGMNLPSKPILPPRQVRESPETAAGAARTDDDRGGPQADAAVGDPGVVLDGKRARGLVWTQITWQTGATTEHWVQRRVLSYAEYADLEQLEQRGRELHAAGRMDAAIAPRSMLPASKRPMGVRSIVGPPGIWLAAATSARCVPTSRVCWRRTTSSPLRRRPN